MDGCSITYILCMYLEIRHILLRISSSPCGLHFCDNTKPPQAIIVQKSSCFRIYHRVRHSFSASTSNSVNMPRFGLMKPAGPVCWAIGMLLRGQKLLTFPAAVWFAFSCALKTLHTISGLRKLSIKLPPGVTHASTTGANN